MDRDDMFDTGATVATAAGIRQARRKFFRKVYRTLYSGVPKRIGPVIALGSILSRFTKTASSDLLALSRLKQSINKKEKTAAMLAPMRLMRKDYLKAMLDYRRAASAPWEKTVATNAAKDALGMIRSGEAAQRALKAVPTAQNYHHLIQESGIRNIDSTLHKKLRHRYGNI